LARPEIFSDLPYATTQRGKEVTPMNVKTTLKAGGVLLGD
jgi:hypothetical protein